VRHSQYVESRRRRKPKHSRYVPFNVAPLTKEREELEEKRIREAYDREARSQDDKEGLSGQQD
jgi:hypothetical protein